MLQVQALPASSPLPEFHRGVACRCRARAEVRYVLDGVRYARDAVPSAQGAALRVLHGAADVVQPALSVPLHGWQEEGQPRLARVLLRAPLAAQDVQHAAVALPGPEVVRLLEERPALAVLRGQLLVAEVRGVGPLPVPAQG